MIDIRKRVEIPFKQMPKDELRLSLSEALDLYERKASKRRKGYSTYADFSKWINEDAIRYVPSIYNKVLVCPEAQCKFCFKGEFHFEDLHG